MKRILIPIAILIALLLALMWRNPADYREAAEHTVVLATTVERSAVKAGMADDDICLSAPEALRAPENDLKCEVKEITEEEYTEPVESLEEPEYLGEYRITFYCNCEICCGSWADGATASGAWPAAGWTVACGEDIPFGTILLIDGQEYMCEDRGVPSGCVDIYVDDHQEALDRGMYYTEVYLVE